MSKTEIKEALRNLAGAHAGLDTLYEGYIERISLQQKGKADLARAILSWVVYARRMLSVVELREALAVSRGSATTKLDEESLMRSSDIEKLCAGLVKIDKASGTVQLFHPTAATYLLEKQRDWLANAHARIASTCLTYISMHPFTPDHLPALSTTRAAAPTTATTDGVRPTYAFLKYAVAYWADHTRHDEERVAEQAVRFLLNPGTVRTVGQLGVWLPQSTGDAQTPPALTGVHVAASFGLDALLARLIAHNAPVDTPDNLGCTPLSYAAAAGLCSGCWRTRVSMCRLRTTPAPRP
jgi:hypothetical protein